MRTFRSDLGTFSPSFDVQGTSVEASPGEPRYQNAEWLLPVSRAFFETVASNDEQLIGGMHRALNLIEGSPVGRKELLNLSIPYRGGGGARLGRRVVSDSMKRPCS